MSNDFNLSSEDPLVRGGFSPFSTLTVEAEPKIVTAIRRLSLPQEVMGRAIEIFYRIYNGQNGPKKIKSIKGTRETCLIFYCVFMSYNELQNPVDPIYAANLVSL